MEGKIGEVSREYKRSVKLARAASNSAVGKSMTPGLETSRSGLSSTSGLERTRKWRRVMTSEEKKEYRKRRARGACGDCKRKKRKCLHDESRTEEGGGYEGDCELGITHEISIGTEEGAIYQTSVLEEQVLIPERIPDASISSHTAARASDSSSFPWPNTPWPAYCGDMTFDMSYSLAVDDATTGSWAPPFEFALLSWPQKQACAIPGFSPPLSGTGGNSVLLSGCNDVEDETYQSSEETDLDVERFPSC